MIFISMGMPIYLGPMAKDSPGDGANGAGKVSVNITQSSSLLLLWQGCVHTVLRSICHGLK